MFLRLLSDVCGGIAYLDTGEQRLVCPPGVMEAVSASAGGALDDTKYEHDKERC